MAWYSAGSVSVTNGLKAVVGIGTLWASQVSRGDIFTIDGVNLYAVESVANDTHINLATAYLGANASGQAYVIERAGALITPSPQTSADIAAFVAKWDLTLNELLAWLTVAGITTLTNPSTGASVSVKTPTQIEADFTAAQAGITASAVAAAGSAATAQAQVSLATTQANNASASAITAAADAITATTQAGVATTQAGNASTSAGTATTQAGIATTQAGNAATQASNASASAIAADASAVSAQSFATGASSSATIASTKATAATNSAISAAASETNAGASAASAIVSKDAAAVSAASVAGTQVASANSATAALDSQNAAAASAVTASTKAAEAVGSANAAAASAAGALAIYGNTSAMNTAVALTSSNAGIATTQAGISSASAQTAASGVLTQLTALKTQTETARDAAIAGLGAADQSQNLVVLSAGIQIALDLITATASAVAANAVTAGVTAETTRAVDLTLLSSGIQAALDMIGIVARQVSGGTVQLAAGSAAEPSLWPTADRNTGVCFPAADALALVTAGLERLRVDASGNLGIGTNAPSGLLDVNDNRLRVRTAKTPATAAAAGNAGEICWDASFFYVCTATNTWKRSALATW